MSQIRQLPSLVPRSKVLYELEGLDITGRTMSIIGNSCLAGLELVVSEFVKTDDHDGGESPSLRHECFLYPLA